MPAFRMHAREHEGVGVDDPLEVGKEVCRSPLDVRQRNIDDRDVERSMKIADADDD